MIGPGKYDELATDVREKSKAMAVVVIVLGGSKGSGFSVQALGAVAVDVMLKLGAMLRTVAAEIERDIR